MYGYHGRFLRIDASAGTTDLVRLEADVLRRFLGGVGLGAYLLGRETSPGVEPLGPDSALIFALGPLVGTPLTTSAKFAVVGFSPLTGRICDALSSSHFAIAAKRAGWDALVITGERPKPSFLAIGPEGATWHDADDLWGRSASEAQRRIREGFGPDWQVAAIGPAGESRIPFATISHDGRHAGRGGLGAVLGSKRIKAIAVRGDARARVPLANPSAVVALAKDLSARSFGPATAKYRELGTMANLLVFNRFAALPTRNFQRGKFAEAEALAGFDLRPAQAIARKSCAACTIGCEHLLRVAGRNGSGTRVEYESLYALGPMCGVSDPDLVLQAAAACDDYGVDTISTGATIAFLMECAERGWIDGAIRPGSRTALRFGDGASVLEAIEALKDGVGLGGLIALGSRRAAERIGGEAPSIAPHVKGLELPGYDPRALHTMALGLAVATRGADHNRSGAYQADFSDQLDRLGAGVEHAQAAIVTEDAAALWDSLILCKFLRGVFDDFSAEAAAMLQAVTGWDYSARELGEVAARIVNARKRLNQREGWMRAEDTLPPRLLEGGEMGLSRAQLDEMIAHYYRLRGWDEQGRVPEGENGGDQAPSGPDHCSHKSTRAS